ncbi:hypothetical protein ABT160_36975 [Streptomyces sp. NPDC001941]|uniref:hypothetical protein n=1 Tax=Streptomyces sp. NPDC001941 TaxID=3154659 RepID=UPI0033302663
MTRTKSLSTVLTGTFRRTSALLAAAVGTVCLAAPTAAPAAAASAAASVEGCPYPYVCFYLTSGDFDRKHPTAMYQDVTPGFQNLGPQSKGSFAIVNTRRDDDAVIRLVRNGKTSNQCVGVNNIWTFVTYQGTATGIKIVNSPKGC